MDTINLYLKELSNDGSTKEESLELLIKAREGDEQAREKLTKNYLLLVVKIAREFMNMGVPLGDLICEGNIGLLTAVDKFKFEKGSAFSTCAKQWIRAAIIRNCMHKRRIVRLPENISELMRSDRWNGIQYREVSIDSPNEEGDSMAADIPDTSNFKFFMDEEEMLTNKRVENVLSFLKDRDAQVIRAYYGIGKDNEPMEVEKVAEQFNLSTTRIQQIVKASIVTMREASDVKEVIRPKKNLEPVEEVEVITALYGFDEKVFDVTEKLNAMILRKEKIRANNKLAGDPCYGKPKCLTITYIMGDHLLTQSFPEGSIVKF
jgi:RNA polymerase primary sigma factor